MRSFNGQNINIEIYNISYYMSPIVWKGDKIGHTGYSDAFFWVLEGECFLIIDSKPCIAKPGQLVYLPKGKHRVYTTASEKFTMYEMLFSVTSNSISLMEALDLHNDDYVVDVPNKDEMSRLFEDSNRTEMFKNPIYDVSRCANVINVIKIYAELRQRQQIKNRDFFEPVVEYMEQNLKEQVTLEELSQVICMQPNYFIRKFKAAFGVSPLAYHSRLRLYEAMRLLSSTEYSFDQIALEIGITDPSYFSRFFKKGCGFSPSEYRNTFRK